MSAESAQQVLFADTLTCEELRPAMFLPGVLDAAELATANARGETLLQSLAVVEDGVRSEEPEQPSEHALQRLEAKVDLLTALVASLCADQYNDPVQSLQWSARGASLSIAAPVAEGTAGWFRVRPTDGLPSPLVLPATVLACGSVPDGSTRVWLRFGPLSQALQGALERHLFRVHRRAVAESRRPR
jgi:hypothetical protein